MLVKEIDHRKFVELVAARMGVDGSRDASVDDEGDVRPALLVHTSLATVKYVLDLWPTLGAGMASPFHVQLEEAPRITLGGFDPWPATAGKPR